MGKLWFVATFDDDVVPPGLAHTDVSTVSYSFDMYAPPDEVSIDVDRGRRLIPDVASWSRVQCGLRHGQQPIDGGFGPFAGIDRLAVASVSGSFPFDIFRRAAGVAQRRSSRILARATVARLVEGCECLDDSPDIPVSDSVQMVVPLELLAPTADPMCGGCEGRIEGVIDIVELQPVATAPPAGPVVDVAQAASPGDPVSISGEGFTAGTLAELSIDHEPVTPIGIRSVWRLLHQLYRTCAAARRSLLFPRCCGPRGAAGGEGAEDFGRQRAPPSGGTHRAPGRRPRFGRTPQADGSGPSVPYRRPRGRASGGSGPLSRRPRGTGRKRFSQRMIRLWRTLR